MKNQALREPASRTVPPTPFRMDIFNQSKMKLMSLGERISMIIDIANPEIPEAILSF